MAKSYRPVLRDQPLLLPPDMREWLPADQLVWFLLDTVEVLDTSNFDWCRRRGGAGAASYDPRMLLGRAHLAREISAHQARLDGRAAILAAGKKPMGAPPVPMEQRSPVIRARQVIEAALVAEQRASTATPVKNPLPKTFANITDPQSRLMPTRKGFLQGYSAQFAITADQIIVATQLGQNTNDMSSFFPMMKAAVRASVMLHDETNRPGHILGAVLADAGCCSDRNLAAPGPQRLIALSKARDHAASVKAQPANGESPAGATPRQAMSHRLRTQQGAQLYMRRGATLEPGIGNLKKILDRFS